MIKYCTSEPSCPKGVTYGGLAWTAGPRGILGNGYAFQGFEKEGVGYS